MGYGSRKPTSNDIPPGIPSGTPEFLWRKEHDLDSHILARVHGKAADCKGCKRLIRREFLKEGLCPECVEKTDD
jgi:hypothetical protein